MKVETIRLEKYDWKVTVFLSVTTYHIDEIISALDKIGCPRKIRLRVLRNLLKDDMDTGFTYSNTRERSSVVVVGRASSPAQFLNSLEHELRHLCDDVATACNLEIRGEEVAYLTGDTNEQLWKVVHPFICCKCRPRQEHNR